MLADEMTRELRAARDAALAEARAPGKPVEMCLVAKGVSFGSLLANPDGTVDMKGVTGVDPDLRVRPFFAHGGTMSIREFIIGALNNEMGMQANDEQVHWAGTERDKYITPSGMTLDGGTDSVELPPDPDTGGRNGVATALVDYLEFYLLNYFKPAQYEQSPETERGRALLGRLGCTGCHVANMRIEQDRRVADVETAYDPQRGVFNSLFATAIPTFRTEQDGSGYPALKLPRMEPFEVRDLFTDFKRHDVGPGFYERNYDGTMRKESLTAALWGVGSTSPYGHDGRSTNLSEVILRHGGEAQRARDNDSSLGRLDREDLLAFLNSLVLFPPDDTASTLDPGDRAAEGFPQVRHGSIRLTALFNDPADFE